MGEICKVCGTPFEVTGKRKKTCSTPCALELQRRNRRAKERRRAREKQRRREARLRLRPDYIERQRARSAKWYEKQHALRLARVKFCERCGVVELTGILGVRFCKPCLKENHRVPPQPPHPCERCGVMVMGRRRRCVPCTRLNQIERLREDYHSGRDGRRQRSVDMMAANSTYRELFQPPKQRPKIYVRRCLVCEIDMSNQPKQHMICSEQCMRDRMMNRGVAHYWGLKLPRHKKPKNEIYASKLKRKRKPYTYKPRTERARAYDRERRAIYAAFRDLGLLPTKEGQP